MKLAEIAILSVLGLLAWTQWQEWQLNRNDAITLVYQGVPVVSLWQCGQLKQKMADLTDHATAEAFEGGEPFGKRLSLTQDERGRTVGRVAA